MSEAEYHPADPHFNPAHPDHEGWAAGPRAPQMPAEAQIVRDFADAASAPPAEAGIVQAHADGVIAAEHVALPDDSEPEQKKTTRKRS